MKSTFVNKVILIGSLMEAPSLLDQVTGIRTANVVLNTQDNFGNHEKMIVEFKRGLADIAVKHFKKGDTLFIEGNFNFKPMKSIEDRLPFTIIAKEAIKL